MKLLVKRNLAVFTAVLMIFGTFIAGEAKAYAASGDTTVYITKSGKKYHADGCQHLNKSKIATTLENAVKKGKTPCKDCNPVTLDDASATPAPATKAVAPAATNNTAAATPATADATVEALKTYKGNTKDFNAYTYYINNADLQTAIGADGDKLLKHYIEYGKAEGRIAK